MKARWLTLFASVPLAVGALLVISCGGVGGPTSPPASPGSNAPTQAFLALLSPAQRTAKYVGAVACAAAACHGGAPASSNAGHPAVGHGPSPSGTPTPTLASLPTSGHPAPQLTGPEVGQYPTWSQTVHATNNVSCESCHGPGSLHAATPTNPDGTPNAILTFPNIASTVVCGQCHGPQLNDWASTPHAQLIADPVQSTQSSPTSSSECFVCHGGLTRAQWTENGIQFAQMTSAQVVTTATNELNVLPQTALCATCHNPHANTKNLTGTGGQAYLYEPVALTDPTLINPGTTPVQYTNAPQTCGECHNGRGTTATDAYLTANTSRPSVHHSNQLNSLLGVGGWEDPAGPPQRTTTHATIPGQCTTCHMGTDGKHTMVVNTDTGCVPCHSSTDATNRVAALKTEIVDDLTQLSTTMSNWAVTTFNDAQDWDYTSNITDGSTPNESLVPIQIKRARHEYYYIVTSGDFGVHNAAYTRYLVQEALSNLQALGLDIVPKSSVQSMPMSVKLNAIQQARKTSSTNDKFAMR